MKLSIIAALAISVSACTTQPTQQNFTMGGHEVVFVKLDSNRYQIGNILLDKGQRSFELTGKFIRQELPIEFLAVAKDGQRGYESLLEFDVNVYEFNLACILIGLDENKGKPPQAHFDPTPIEGDAVEIWLTWEKDGKSLTFEASEFFVLNGEKLKKGDWVYTGSMFDPQGTYLADAAGGTLVGFVHDPASIIEHGRGFGPQSFGGLVIAQDLLPAIDTPVKVLFKYVGNTQ